MLDKAKKDLELFYNANSDAKLFNNIFEDLKLLSIEYARAKFPVLSALKALEQDKLLKIEEERLEKLGKLVKEANERIELLDKNKFDREFVRTEEFARIVFDILDKARIDYREEKLKYYANMLVNYSTVDFSKDFYKEGIIEKISKYSGEHILVLNKSYKLYNTQNEKGSLPKGSFKKNYIKINLNPKYIDLCIIDLKTDGFLNEITGFRLDSSVVEDFIISDYGIRCIELITNKNLILEDI